MTRGLDAALGGTFLTQALVQRVLLTPTPTPPPSSPPHTHPPHISSSGSVGGYTPPRIPAESAEVRRVSICSTEVNSTVEHIRKLTLLLINGILVQFVGQSSSESGSGLQPKHTSHVHSVRSLQELFPIFVAFFNTFPMSTPDFP